MMSITIKSADPLESKIQVFNKNLYEKQIYNSKTNDSGDFNTCKLVENKIVESLTRNDHSNWSSIDPRLQLNIVEKNNDVLVNNLLMETNELLTTISQVNYKKVFPSFDFSNEHLFDDDFMTIRRNIDPTIVINENNYKSNNIGKKYDNLSSYDSCLNTIKKLEYFISKINNNTNEFNNRKIISKSVNKIQSNVCQSQDDIRNLNYLPQKKDDISTDIDTDKILLIPQYDLLNHQSPNDNSAKYSNNFIQLTNTPVIIKKKSQNSHRPRNIFLKFLHERRKLVTQTFDIDMF